VQNRFSEVTFGSGWAGVCFDSLILKNPIATNIQAINFRISPIIGIIAPTSKITPAVLKMFSVDFIERASNDFL